MSPKNSTNQLLNKLAELLSQFNDLEIKGNLTVESLGRDVAEVDLYGKNITAYHADGEEHEVHLDDFTD